jgi:hypothetical protein
MLQRVLLLLALLLSLPFQALAADDINVSATVPAQPSDYSIEITRLTPVADYKQETILEYRITYGSNLSYATDIRVETHWPPGTVEGEQTTVNVLDYVSGSAINGYGGAVPVIDTTNKKITWNISSFPANTTQTLTFKVKTNSNYQGSKKVLFKLNAKLFAPGVSISEDSQLSAYKYQESEPSSSSSSTPTPTPTQTPSAMSTKPLIKLIEVREILDNEALIIFQTEEPTRLTVRYGKSITSLPLSSQSGSSLTHSVRLTNLDSDSIYYFRGNFTLPSGRSVNSEIFTFKTAVQSEAVEVDTNSLIATTNDVVLSDPSDDKRTNNTLIIPESTTFQVKFALKLKDGVGIKKVEAIVRNKQVLGIFSGEAEANTEVAELIEIEPGVYTGRLKTKPEPGTYELYARITDTNGNITEQKIAEIKVIGKLRILSKKDRKPIEGARIKLFIFEPSNKRYIPIPPSSLPQGNPVFSNSEGKVDIALPIGKYKITVSDLNYKDQDVEFEINKESGFPTVLMEKEPLSIFKVLRYYGRSANEVFLEATRDYTKSLTGSVRFFDLTASMALASLVLLALFSFTKRHHLPFSGVVSYFFYLRDRKKKENYIHGVIYGVDDKPIPSANVYLSDKETEEIIGSTKTNNLGEFFFRRNPNGRKYLIMAMRKGFKTSPLVKYEGKDHVKFKVSLEKDDLKTEVLDKLSHISSSVCGSLFEILLVLTLGFEILFIMTFGVAKTLPFLVVSVFNFALWTMHLRHSNTT